jgi:hypothetical protein
MRFLPAKEVAELLWHNNFNNSDDNLSKSSEHELWQRFADIIRSTELDLDIPSQRIELSHCAPPWPEDRFRSN